MSANWYDGVKGLLLDVTGVLYESGPDGGVVIPGSVDAINRLRASGLPFKLISNESTAPKEGFAAKLKAHGFDVSTADMLLPGPAMAAILNREKLRPHLLVHPDLLDEFETCDKDNPNCVVMGDCQEHFTYDALNKAFTLLIQCDPADRNLFALGAGKYYSEGGHLVLDVGSYAKMLAHACSCEVVTCGKPDATFFGQGLKELGLDASQVAMIGDDIVSDVGGAQAVGMKGLQVRTGKYRKSTDEPHPKVNPDAYVDNLAQAVDQLLSKN